METGGVVLDGDCLRGSRGNAGDFAMMPVPASRLPSAPRPERSFDVLLTRTDDSFLPLASRVQFGRDHAADLFLSIHADSEHVGSVRGATVYTLSDKASDQEAAALAAAAGFDSGADCISSIFIVSP